jgi:hypothetical protein
VFQHLKTTMIFHSTHKSVVRETYTQEIQKVFKLTLLDTLVAPVGTPSSGSTSDKTCIQTGLGILKSSIDQSIGHLTAIVPPRIELEKILSSKWVI